jgi:hypothetical protein
LKASATARSCSDCHRLGLRSSERSIARRAAPRERQVRFTALAADAHSLGRQLGTAASVSARRDGRRFIHA